MPGKSLKTRSKIISTDMKKSVYSLVLYGMAVIMALTACQGKKQDAPARVPDIPVVEAIQNDIPVRKEFVGEIYGISDIPIRARVEGWLEEISFAEGRLVKKGQVLYRIDPKPLQAEVNAANSQLAEAQTMLAKAESDYSRYKPLAEINAVSQSDLDWAKAQYEAARASVDAAKASLDLANIKLGYTLVKAPIHGIIGKTKAREGEFVGRSPNPVILNTVSRIDTVRVEFFLTEADYLTLARRFLDESGRDSLARERQIEEFRVLKLVLSDGSIHPYDGSIDFIDREVSSESGALLVQASFPNPTGILRPGQFARVVITLDFLPGAILIPQRSVMELQGIRQVYVVNDNKEIEIRRLETGPTYLDYWIVTDGLQAGDKVVLEGVQKVGSGMVVNPVVTEFQSISKTKP
jgi:membrane fusion protein (multidrug efflux system)